MNNSPKDVRVLDCCNIYDNKTHDLIFIGRDVDERQENPVTEDIGFGQKNPVTEDIGFGQKRTIAGDIHLIISGKCIKSDVASIMQLDGISFYVRYKRTDVIEILKFGNYLSMTGEGIISNVEYGFDRESENKIIIRVKGEIKIK